MAGLFWHLLNAMQVHYSTDKIIGLHGDLVRAKRDKNGDIILYVDAIAFDYDDQKHGIREYLKCFKEWNEDAQSE